MQILLLIYPFKAYRLLYVPPALKLKKKLLADYIAFMCFVWISEQTVPFLYTSLKYCFL